jgi:hypothetical protein
VVMQECGIFYSRTNNNNISVMELGHLLTRSGLTHPEVSSKVKVKQPRYSPRLAQMVPGS